MVNTHALHNVDLLHETLPRPLLAPKPYLQLKDLSHQESAAKLHEIRATKRSKAAKARRRKKAEAAGQAEQSSDEVEEEGSEGAAEANDEGGGD